jgi:hypothetical protein
MLWRSYLFHTGHLCCASVSCVLLNDLMQTNIGGVCLCCSIFCFVHHCWSFSSLFFSPLCCLFLDLRLLITPFDIFKHFAIVLSVLLRFTASDYPFGIFKLFAIVLSVLLRFTASDYPFDIFKLFAIVLSVLLRFTASDYPLWYFQTFRHCVVCSSIYGF